MAICRNYRARLVGKTKTPWTYSRGVHYFAHRTFNNSEFRPKNACANKDEDAQAMVSGAGESFKIENLFFAIRKRDRQ